MRYLDLVELTKDKKEYLLLGVKKGMFGVVMSKKCVNRKWKVVFSNFIDNSKNKEVYVSKRHLMVHNLITLIDKAVNKN